MKKYSLLLLFIFNLTKIFAQNTLPEISIKNTNGKIVVSWLNDYKKNVTNIFVQRSFDSLRNFSTIGSVLIPQNLENGYLDNRAPYDRMYYRVSITFEGGTYEIGPSFKASPSQDELISIDITDTLHKIQTKGLITIETKQEEKKIISNPPIKTQEIKTQEIKTQEINVQEIKTQEIKINYPSNLIFINNQNIVQLNLIDSKIKNYKIKFYDELNNILLELNNLKEDTYYMDKFNFNHTGWIFFDIFLDEKLIEKNKILILSDVKRNNK